MAAKFQHMARRDASIALAPCLGKGPCRRLSAQLLITFVINPQRCCPTPCGCYLGMYIRTFNSILGTRLCRLGLENWAPAIRSTAVRTGAHGHRRNLFVYQAKKSAEVHIPNVPLRNCAANTEYL